MDCPIKDGLAVHDSTWCVSRPTMGSPYKNDMGFQPNHFVMVDPIKKWVIENKNLWLLGFEPRSPRPQRGILTTKLQPHFASKIDNHIT